MSNGFELMVVAQILTEEKLRDHRKERVTLEPGLNLGHLIHDLLRRFK
jgi:hypothetical protein